MKGYSRIELILVGLVIFAAIAPLALAVVLMAKGPLESKTFALVDTAFGILSLCWASCLLAWLRSGQHVSSRLWIWMPPFVFFGKLPLGFRTVVVIALSLLQMVIFAVKIFMPI